ncbi:hypothetical protein EV191_109217 [Tamaricihabitans halophyticus]|uniref:Uncharacterized protein n=1 Tax=Tamaricihabitans halophyticus TaxID=1262583 RepID=A0A4R2QQU0_9PSEU|nr:hypothetical protein [Tamaricihabitans halophyticus]TCP49395.1 hypothetical protein EV191_109217 [Tamaricihabitans halophyticus]
MTGKPRPGRASAAQSSDDESLVVDTADTSEDGDRARRGLPGVLLAAAVATVLLIVAAVQPVVRGAEPAFGSGGWLIALAVLPLAIALLFAASGKPVVARGVIIGAAALVPGRVLADLQFLDDASVVSRPELYLPDSLASPAAATGFWAMLAGHALWLVAGVLAIRRGDTEGGADSIDGFGGPGVDGAGSDAPGSEAPAVSGSGVVAPEGAAGARLNANQRGFMWVLLIAALAAIGLLMAPFSSADPYLLALPVVESAAFTLAGGVLLALSVPLAAGLAVSAASRGTTRGVLLGVAIGLGTLQLPPLIAGLTVADLGPKPGPFLVLAAALAFVLVALSAAGRDRPLVSGDVGARRPVDRDPRLPGESTLHRITGVLAVLAGASAIVAGYTAHVLASSSPGFGPAGLSVTPTETVDSYTKLMLLPAGAVVALLGVLVAVGGGFGVAVRPALSVAWVGIPLVGAGALDTAVAATELGTARAGAGVFWTCAAMFLAAVVGVACAVAGSVEREEDGTDRAGPASVALLAALFAGGLLAFGAFGVPAMRADDYLGADLLGNFRISSVGLFAGLLAVLLAIVLASRSRPARGAALLVGAASLPALRLLELPLTGERATGAAPGPGMWLSLACAGVLLLAAILGWASRRAGVR